MATNFSVNDAAVKQFLAGQDIEVTRYRAGVSAVIQAVTAAGGEVIPNLAPIPTSMTVVSGQSAIGASAESTVAATVNKPNSTREATSVDLLVKAHAEVERITSQALAARLIDGASRDAFATSLAAKKLPAIMAGFDLAALSPLVSAGATVEYDATDPVASLSALVAGFDDTPYGADAMILTKAGARKLRYATDANKLVQFGNDVPFDGPIFRTELTGTQLGSATLMGIVGPFAACAVGYSTETLVKTFDQLEPTAGGAQQNIISFLVERYAGFVAPPVAVVPATGWKLLVDAA